MFRSLVGMTLCLSLLPFFADAAALYLDPISGTYGRGDTFAINVRINNAGECINAAEIEVRYPKETMRAVDFSRGSSILSLWVEEPWIDTENGIVRFSGGIPGGYCGRIQGDPVISNVLGRIIFTVISAESNEARVRISPESLVYLNDGLGTAATVSVEDAVFSLVPQPTLSENEWLKEVGEDTIPPDAFEVQVESTQGVFDGKYYLVFSTLDKQSGLDHYELFEREVWKRIESPYQLRDQALRDPVQVKAIDKAGNERLGSFDPTTIPTRKTSKREYTIIIGILLLLLAAGAVRMYTRRDTAEKTVSIPPGT